MGPDRHLPVAGGAVAAADRSIRRLVTVVVPLWGAGIAATALGHPAGTPVAMSLAGGLAVALGYAVYVARGPSRVLVGCVTASALGVAVASPPVATLTTSPVLAPWLAMATTVTGALVLTRTGPALVLAVAVLGGAAVALRGGSDLLSVCALVAQALTVGWCMWGGLSTLRAGARTAEAQAGAAARSQTESACEAARVAEVQRTARQLHDTVINTLGAIRGLPITDVAILRERCASDLAELSRSEPPDPSVSELFNRLSARARVLGLRLTVRASGIGSLSETVAEALEGAMGEALVNCAKHSGCHHVHLAWQWDGASGSAELADDGRGFGSAHLAHGGAQSILTRCREAGIRVETFDRGGAVVRWAWSAVPPSDPTPPATLAPVMGTAAGRVVTVVAVFGLYATAITPLGAGRAGSMTAVAILAAVAGWAALSSRAQGPRPLPWPLLGLAALVVTLLPAAGLPGCSRVGVFWWGPLAGLAVLVCLVLIDGRAVAIAAGVIGYTVAFIVVLTGTAGMTGSCGSETTAALALCLSIVGALVSFRLALVMHWSEAAGARQSADERARHDAEQAVRQAVRERELSRAMQVSSPLLAGIAEGHLDPLDPAVRAACGRAEGILRAIMTLGPEHGPIAEEMASVVLLAGARGISVRVRVDGQLPCPPVVVDEMARTLHRWVGTIPARASVSLTTLGIAGEGLLLATCTPAIPLPPGHPAAWSIGEDEGTIDVEARWDSHGWVGTEDRVSVTAG